MPIILTSIDRYGSLMVAEYTPKPCEKDHWDFAMLAERMKSELFEPPINMLFVDARGEVARVVYDATGSGKFSTDHANVPRVFGAKENELAPEIKSASRPAS